MRSHSVLAGHSQSQHDPPTRLPRLSIAIAFMFAVTGYVSQVSRYGLHNSAMLTLDSGIF